MSIRNEVELMFKSAINQFGKIDILVNNAGVASSASLLETTDEIWDRVFDVNLKGVFLCTQTAARYMVQERYGKIVNIAANSGFGIADWGETAYAASKAGVIQLTKTAVFELWQFILNSFQDLACMRFKENERIFTIEAWFH